MEESANEAARASRLVVLAGEGAAFEAEGLAERLGVSLVHDEASAQAADLVLRADADGLALVDGGMVLRGDFTRMLPRLRQSNLARELLVRAAKVKGVSGDLTAVDATAGLGEDALLLAAVGFAVTLFEKDPVVAALLADALRRAADAPELAGAVARMQVVEGDSVSGLRELGFSPDVVYLDPMFPARRKSAAVKKKFQLIHQLELPCKDQEALVAAALSVHPRKVVIKRPLKGEKLAGVKPSYSLAGKAIRYDCLVPPRPGCDGDPV